MPLTANCEAYTAPTNQPEKPFAAVPDWDQIPKSLKSKICWILWRHEWDASRKAYTKIPYQVPRNGTAARKAQTDNPATWAPFEDVKAAYLASQGTASPFDGIGICRTGNDVLVDWDGCLDKNNSFIRWAWPGPQPGKMIEALEAFGYIERSPSLSGLHGYFSDPTGKIRESIRVSVRDEEHTGVEVYADTARFFAVTGNNWDEGHYGVDAGPALEQLVDSLRAVRQAQRPARAVAPQPEPDPPEGSAAPILSDEDVLRIALRNERFERLWHGDSSAATGDTSPSGLDAALCYSLAFYTQKNAAQMDRLFRQSDLMRDKWDERRGAQTYGELTIGHAIREQDQTFTPRENTKKRKTAVKAKNSNKQQSDGPQPVPDGPQEPPAEESVPDPSSAAWKALLVRGKGGRVMACEANVRFALLYAPEWKDAGIVLDEFANVIRTRGPVPWGGPVESWTDADSTHAAMWLQEQGVVVSPGIVSNAVHAFANQHRVHPLREYLDSLEWDGEKRIDSWLIDYLGVEESNYARLAGTWWLGGAVARAFHPGAKVDYVLVLEGDQGDLKSTAFQVLAGHSGFTDSVSDFTSKDAAMDLQGKWIVELGEFDRLMVKPSVVKAFITRTSDHFRPPYERHSGDFPRQCVFAGSINLHEYFSDSTGNRRFWPVKCGKIDLEKLRADRDQLWAEAVDRYRDDNAVRWPSTAEELNWFSEQQEEREDLDVWHDQIAAWIIRPREIFDSKGHPLGPFTSTPTLTTVADVLTHCIGVEPKNQNQAMKKRIAATLKRLGWKCKLDGPKKERYRAYVPDEEKRKEWEKSTNPSGSDA